MGSLRNPARRAAPTKAGRKKLGVHVTGLIEAGLIDPPLELERRYRNQRLRAQIRADGSVDCMGRNFCTLSSAASYARSTCRGPVAPGAQKLSSNGWTFWQYRNEEGELESLRLLRRRFLKG